MNNIFKGAEIVKIAIQIERNGFEFYKEIANRTSFFTVKELFEYLANQEVKHEKIFETLLSRVGDYVPVESYPGEYDMYLKALAGENIFTKDGSAKITLEKISSESQAVDAGIGFEKDSIIFFSEMKNFSPKEDHAAIERIVNEEKVHLRKLSRLRGELNNK